MLHSKKFNTLEAALAFANDNTNKVIPVTFLNGGMLQNNLTIILVYEAVEIPEPNNHQIDLLNNIDNLLRDIIALDFVVTKHTEETIIILKDKITKCLNSL